MYTVWQSKVTAHGEEEKSLIAEAKKGRIVTVPKVYCVDQRTLCHSNVTKYKGKDLSPNFISSIIKI